MTKVLIGAVEYDSYESVADATTYLGGDVLRSTAWALQNADAQARGLVSATRMLMAMPWCDGPPPFDDNVPQAIQDITAKLAADLLAKPKLFSDATGNSNIKVVKAGSASVEFFSPVDGGPPLPRSLWDELLATGLICPGGDGSGILAGAEFTGTEGCRPLWGRYPWDWPIAEQDYG